MKRLLFLLLLVALCNPSIDAQDRTSGRAFATRSEVLARNGMVATSHPLATQAGIEILKNGGNAIDAAIAANALLGLVDPGMNGIGGDLFAIVWDARTKKLHGLNASGRSARALTRELFASRGLTRVPSHGPLPITVPGCVDGWFELHGRFGKTPMPRLLAPVIAYARAGVPITQEVADLMADRRLRRALDAPGPGAFATFRQLYMKGGAFPKKGEIFSNPELADTLNAIAKGGRDAFYKGPIARDIVAHLEREGGLLGVEDFARHRSEWVEPVSTNYRGYDVWEMPPNAQGVSVLHMLNVLEGYDLRAAGFGSAQHLHYLTEAKKLAYEDLAAVYGDPEGRTRPVSRLVSKTYAAQRRALIKDDVAGVYGPGPTSDDHTVYLTTADADGNMVSLIQSNSANFGSLVVPAGLGFVLHNRGQWYELADGHVNSYAPGKRPFHTIIPGFVTKDRQPFMSFGVMGGDMQPQGHVQVLTNMIDFDMNLQEAGDAPRLYHTGTFPRVGHLNDVGELSLESGFPPETVRDLLRMGHRITHAYGVYGGYQAIMRKNGVYYGASESRKDGQAAGY